MISAYVFVERDKQKESSRWESEESEVSTYAGDL